MTTTNRRIVMKFGGASLASPEHFENVAKIVKRQKTYFPEIVIVVSAMGKTTDELIALAKSCHPNPPRREYDMLISVGERISMSLLAMVLSRNGFEVISFTGSQSGIITSNEHSDAKIVDIRPKRIKESLEKNKIVIVAGFQGVSLEGEITTLGRNGSDTTAVALASALNAEKVAFFKNVKGVYSENPHINKDAAFHSSLTYKEALKIVDNGSDVLCKRSLLLAMKNEMPLQVLSFEEETHGTYIGNSDSKNKTLTPQFEV